MWHGGHPGTGVIIPRTGGPGGPTTGITTTGTIITGITIITHIIITGIIFGAGTTRLTIDPVYGYTVQLWL